MAALLPAGSQELRWLSVTAATVAPQRPTVLWDRLHHDEPVDSADPVPTTEHAITSAHRHYRFRMGVLRSGWRALRRRWPELHGVTIGPVLEELGWIRSAETSESVDAGGNPIPWITYPAISFLGQRVQSHFRVFEFGSGNSTLWWAARVNRVVSVEDDPTWAALVEQRSTREVEVLRRPSGSSYARAIHDTELNFHVVVVDGAEERNICAEPAMAALTPDGVIVWDNTEREERYRDGLTLLADAGFRRLDFHGLTPLNNHMLCTSVLYRDGNCLGI